MPSISPELQDRKWEGRALGLDPLSEIAPTSPGGDGPVTCAQPDREPATEEETSHCRQTFLTAKGRGNVEEGKGGDRRGATRVGVGGQAPGVCHQLLPRVRWVRARTCGEAIGEVWVWK